MAHAEIAKQVHFTKRPGSHLSLFLSMISQKSSAAARIWRNIGSLVAHANSNCFSKYLFLRKTFKKNRFIDLEGSLAIRDGQKYKTKRNFHLTAYVLLLNLRRAKMKPVIVQSTFTNCHNLYISTQIS